MLLVIETNNWNGVSNPRLILNNERPYTNKCAPFLLVTARQGNKQNLSNEQVNKRLMRNGSGTQLTLLISAPRK